MTALDTKPYIKKPKQDKLQMNRRIKTSKYTKRLIVLNH